MRITVRVPDELGEEVKRRTDNVSAYVTDAISEKLHKEEREDARWDILEKAGGEPPDVDLHALNQRQRRQEDRDGPGQSESR